MGSKSAITHGQEAPHTPSTEPSNPVRPQDTSVGKTSNSSPHKSPLSALRTGEKWTSHTLADVLGLSPGIRGPSLLLSPLCSRAAASSPGPGSRSGSGAHKQKDRQPLMPLEARMKVTANLHSSQPLPEKLAWGEETPGEASKASVRKDSPSTSDTGQGGQHGGQGKAAPGEQGRQEPNSLQSDKQGTLDAGIATMPLSQPSHDNNRDKWEQEKSCDPTDMTPSVPEQPPPPGEQLSLHLTPTLKGGTQQSPPGSEQPKAHHAAESSVDGLSLGKLAERNQPISESVKAAQREQVALPNVSDRGACEAAKQPRAEENALFQAPHYVVPGQATAMSPGTTLSPSLTARDLPETEVQHGPTQLLTPCPAGRSTLVETQAVSPGLVPSSAPAATARGPQSWEGAEVMAAVQHSEACKQVGCETQQELGPSANAQPAHLHVTGPKQAEQQPQYCSALLPMPREEATEGTTAPNRIGLEAYTLAATDMQNSKKPGDLIARDAVSVAATTQGAQHERTAHLSQAPRGPASLARTAKPGSPGPSEQVTDMAWPDSEEIERGVKEAGGDWEEARGLKLIHKFNSAILMGDPAGGVFIAVDKDDMHAMTKAVGVSHDDQSIEAWRRRLLSKRYEHGLLEWELEETTGEAGPQDQLLKSPMPGISALVCTAAEVSARQHLLAASGAVNSMPECEGCAQKVTEEERGDGAPQAGAEGRLQSAGDHDAPSEPPGQSAGPQEISAADAGGGTGKALNLREQGNEPSLQPAQHVPDVCVASGAAILQWGSCPEAKRPKQLALFSSPGKNADERQEQGNAQQPEAQAVLTIGLRVSNPEQQSDQQERQKWRLPAQNSEPAPIVDQLCPSLNLKFFTQAGTLQMGGAELPQHGLEEADNLPTSDEALRERHRESIEEAEAAGHAAPLLSFTETAVEEGGPTATASAPQAGPEQRLALCLQLDATQLEAVLGAADKADATSEEPCITLIPDTMEPCSNSKDTPKSKQQAGQAAADPGHAEAQSASAAEQGEEVQGMTGIPASNAEAAAEADRPVSSLRTPARARRKREKQERAAASLRASSSRRRSQALMLSVPAVRRVAGVAERPAQAAEAGHQAAAGNDHIPIDKAQPHSTSPDRPETSGQGGAAAAADPALADLGPVKGTKRLCRRRDANATAELSAVASMPASLADSTQQEGGFPQHAVSPLHDRLAGDAAPSAAPRAESPLPDWLCSDAPGKSSGHLAKASVSLLWLMDRQEAPPVQACRSDVPQPEGKRQPHSLPGWNVDLADPPSSLVGESGEREGQKGRAAVGAGQSGCRADSAFGAWRSKSGFMQPPQPPPAALEQRHCPTSQHTYKDTFSFPDSQHLSREQPPAAPLCSELPERRGNLAQTDLQHQLRQQGSRLGSPRGKQRQQMLRLVQPDSRDDRHSIEAPKQRGIRRAPHTSHNQDMQCRGRPQRSMKVPRKLSDFTQGQSLDAPPDDRANLPSPRRSPKEWSLMRTPDVKPEHEEEPKQASPAPAPASPASMEQGAGAVSRGCVPDEEEKDGTTAPGGGKAVRLGCSKCRMSRKGCSVCRVKAGLASLCKTRPSPRRPAQKRRASLAEDLATPAPVLPGRPAAAAWPGAAAASPGISRRHARKRSLASLQLDAEASKTPRGNGALAGRKVLLSGFECKKERRAMVTHFAEHGGMVLEGIPESLEGNCPDAVIAKKGSVRGMESLLARVTGIPVLKPSFVQRCTTSGKWRVPGKADAWMLPGVGHRVFDGLRIFLSGESATLETLRRILPYAGARVADSMEEHVHAHARPAKRVCVEHHRGNSSQAKCDIVIVSHLEPLHKHRDLQSLLRQARCLGVPVKSMVWAVEALWSGVIPGSPARPPVAPLPAPAPGRGNPSPCRHTAQQPQAVAHMGAEALADGQAQAVERPEEPIHELIEDSQSLGGTREATPSSPGTHSAKPVIGPGTEQEEESPPARECPAKGPQQIVSTRAAAAASAQEGHAPAAPSGPSLSWHGAPKEPPAGLGLPSRSTRRYYNGFTKDGNVIMVGDAVELCMMPGDQAPQVARLQALWSQAAAGCSERMLAQCCLFYRPSETSFHRGSAPNELFASTHIEERLPLQRISAPCTVDMAGGSKQGMLAASNADYVCTFLYDHKTDTLSTGCVV